MYYISAVNSNAIIKSKTVNIAYIKSIGLANGAGVHNPRDTWSGGCSGGRYP